MSENGRTAEPSAHLTSIVKNNIFKVEYLKKFIKTNKEERQKNKELTEHSVFVQGASVHYVLSQLVQCICSELVQCIWSELVCVSDMNWYSVSGLNW